MAGRAWCSVWAGACLWLSACGGDDGGSPTIAAGAGDAGGNAATSADGGAQSDAATLDFAEFDSVLESFLDAEQLPGATAVVVHKGRGQVHERGYGSFDKDRVSLIASSSKILSVGVLMSLVDAGKLDLDEPISTYLDAWGSYKTDLTTAMLVSNSSGLVSLTQDALYAPYICQYVDTGTLQDCAKTIYTADDSADRAPPDTAFAYGGGQWQLAGGIAEVVSGKSWAELVAQTYVSPCSTESLGYTNQFSQAAGTDYPTFFMADVANLPDTQNPSVEGGAYVTAGDYGKILLMHLRGGLCGENRVLSEASVARMQVDRIAEAYAGSTTSSTLAGYGMGWWVDREHGGVVVDPGAYGAVAWLDGPREYGAFIVLEASSEQGVALLGQAKPALDAAFDAAN